MTDQPEKPGDNNANDMIRQLKESGFLDQIQALEGTLKALAGDLQGLGAVATQRLEETESLAAHVLAMEALLAALIRSVPINRAAVMEEVNTRTAHLSDNSDGIKAVQAIVEDILARSQAMPDPAGEAG